ncbi:MAG: right-handed parallel beta-helix repeat-containing protein [Burkholderiaceae bacterium]|nr:right-handed parallel beta-helix repeat-containing protein [Burkholderiaceae bacterium]
MGSVTMRAVAAAVAMVVIAGCGGASDGSSAEQAPDGEGTTLATTDDTQETASIGTTIEVYDAVTTVTSTSADALNLVVRARATLAGGVGPRIQVRVNGVSVGSVEVRATTHSDHVFRLGSAVPAGARIDVVFGNDATINGQDRNLYVDSVRVNGATLRPTDPGATVDRGTGTAAFDGVDVVDGRGDLLWNAALRLKAPGETLVVRARATSAAGVGPTMQVHVDGVAVGSVEVRSGNDADYRFVLKAAPTQRVDVVYSNDAAAGSEDRNLYIDSVRFADRTLRPTDSGALLDLGVGAAAFDGAHVMDGQSAILWNAALRLPVSASAVAAGNALLGAAAASSTAVAAPPAGAIDIRSTGARCDGSFDNAAAIASAISAAKSKRVAVYVPAGTCAYGSVIRIDGVRLVGAGDASVLYALNPQQQAIFMYGSGAEVSLLKLAGRKATTRQPNYEGTRITLFGATNFVIDKVTIDGATGAGIQTSRSTNNGRITNNVIKNTLADSIHMTDKASYITLENNRIENSGDDGIAVVSYRRDGGLVHHITARNNVILNNKGGRNMSVVGGQYVVYENNRLENNLGGAACVYFAQEASYETHGAHDVTARYNTLKSCGGATIGHGAVHVSSSGEESNTNVTLTRNDIVQNGQPGIRVTGSMNSGVRLDSNRVNGASPALDIKTSGVTVVPYSSGSVGYVAP